MKVYKGFSPELTSIMGDGRKETSRFSPGETKEVPASKTACNGFHSCEYIFDCMSYYPMDGKNRFFEAEASGDIDEDAGNRIASTKITLVRELTPFEIALAGMKYIIDHPKQTGWEKLIYRVTVAKKKAQAQNAGAIAIARGIAPNVKGPEGSILGLLVEDDAGSIIEAKLFIVQPDRADQWLRLGDNREVIAA